MSDLIGQELDHVWRKIRAHRPHYHQPQHPTPPEAPMAIALVTDIENALANAGHEVSDVLHSVLTGHLTIGNLAAHVGQFVQVAEANPEVQLAEKFALGANGAAIVAKFAEDISGLLAAQATPVAEPAPAP